MKVTEKVDYERRFNKLSDAVNKLAASLESGIDAQGDKIKKAGESSRESLIYEGRRIQALVTLHNLHRIIDFYCATKG